MSEPGYLFVTGTPRSGTTLVDKLLSMHPGAHILSQPLPLLYTRCKRCFLTEQPAAEQPAAEQHAAGPVEAASTEPWWFRYPLNDMMGDSHYDPAAFVDFLDHFAPPPGFYREILLEMIPMAGQYTKPADALAPLAACSTAGIFDLVTSYCRALTPKDQPAIVGSKETHCEEYLPYLLAQGAKVLLVLRDPRDVVTSLGFGQGRRYGGRLLPLLFCIRQWRKSVAFSLAYEDHPGLLSIRYEDLVRDPPTVLAEIFSHLGLATGSSELLTGELRDQSGGIWRSNSSHRPQTRISPCSVGRYRRHLPAQVDRLIQATCYAEMRLLGYHLDIGSEAVAEIISSSDLSETLERRLLAHFQWTAQRRSEELRRWHALQGSRFTPQLLLFAAAASRLAQAVR